MDNNINISKGNTILYMYNDIEIDIHDIYISSPDEDRYRLIAEYIKGMYGLHHVTIINSLNNKKCIMITLGYEVIEVEFYHKLDLLTSRHQIVLKKDSLLTLDRKFPFVHNRCEENFIGIVVLYAKDMRILKANKTFLNFLEEPYIQNMHSIGKTFYDIVPDWEGTESEEIWTLPYKEGKSNYRKEVEFKGFERGTTYWDITIEPYIENGEVIYIIGTTREVTEMVSYRKRIEEQSKVILKQNELLEKNLHEKDEFISIVSHELKTPISIIYSIIQLFENTYKELIPNGIERHIKVIKQNTLRQLRLVNNLLEVAKIKTDNMKVEYNHIDIVCYTEAIVDSVVEYAKFKDISIIFDTPVEYKMIPLDDEKYEKIVLNLLSNAIKFTPNGGEVFVDIEIEEENFILKIRDTGIGIPKDKQEVVFDSFGQVDTSLSRENEGTGLGLSIVKSFVAMLGGSITLKSKENEGTTFKLSLPMEIEGVEINKTERKDSLQTNLVKKINIEFSDIYY